MAGTEFKKLREYEKLHCLYNKWITNFLSGLLAVLIPGGPVENRSFAHIAPVILAAFNVFLTILGIMSSFG